MRYLLLIYNSEQAYDAMPEAEREADFNAFYSYDNDITAAGVKLAGEPLLPTTTATTVRFRDGKNLTTHGPFAETKEQLSGFYMIDVPDLDQAILWASKMPTVKYGSVEIRPIMDVMGG